MRGGWKEISAGGARSTSGATRRSPARVFFDRRSSRCSRSSSTIRRCSSVMSRLGCRRRSRPPHPLAQCLDSDAELARDLGNGPGVRAGLVDGPEQSPGRPLRLFRRVTRQTPGGCLGCLAWLHSPSEGESPSKAGRTTQRAATSPTYRLLMSPMAITTEPKIQAGLTLWKSPELLAVFGIAGVETPPCQVLPSWDQ
jgi:hypothetical protein